jgi:hypothetical protein
MSRVASTKRTRIHLGPREQTEMSLAEALTAIKHETGMSFRDMQDYARGLFPGRDGTSHGWFRQIATDNADFQKPRSVIEACELIADMFGLEPEYFREYREIKAGQRAAELTRRVGLDEVMRVLNGLEDKPGKS